MDLRRYFRDHGQLIVSRLVPYWLIVLAACWTLTFLYLWCSDDAYTYYDVTFASKVSQ